MWLKNTEGKKDSMLTMATIAFMVMTINVMLSSVGEVEAFGQKIKFQPADEGTMAIYIGSTFTAYVSRRYTDKRYSSVQQSQVEEVLEQVTSPK